MEEGFKQNSHHLVMREIVSFGNDNTMPILGVPDVVVGEAVDVHLELTVRVQVHVGDEEIVR